MDRLTHIRIKVHRIDEVHFGVFLAEILHGSHHADESFAEVLATMAGDEDEFLSVVKAGDIVAGGLKYIDLFIGKSLVALELIDHHVQRIDDRITSDEDLTVSLLVLEVLLAKGRRGKVVGGNAAGDLPVHLLWPRAIDIVRPESGLDMAHRNLLVEGGKGGGGAGGRVAMNQNHIRLALFEHVAHAGKHASGDIVQVLPLLHDIQVIIRFHVEDAQHLV